jgi:hypothetical protein
VVHRLGENLAANIFFPDVDAFALVERGTRVLARRAQEGFRVEKKLGDARQLPSGLVIQYKALVAGNHRDILVRGQALREHTVAELEKMRRLIETHRPFHDDPEFNDPEIMFDRDELPYLSDPVRDIVPELTPPPNVLHEAMLTIIATLLQLADRGH